MLASLEKAIRSQFAPALRRDGFSGSGRRFWRLIGGQCQVVSVQGSRYGGMFAVNLAIQPMSVPFRWAKVVEPKRLREEECAFRKRLSAQPGDQWWDYLQDQASMDNAVSQACAVYEQVGRHELDAMGSVGSPLNTLTAEAFAANTFDFYGFGNTGALMALTLAQMRKAAGNAVQARSFAQAGLQMLGEHMTASGLQTELRELLAPD